MLSVERKPRNLHHRERRSRFEIASYVTGDTTREWKTKTQDDPPAKTRRLRYTGKSSARNSQSGETLQARLLKEKHELKNKRMACCVEEIVIECSWIRTIHWSCSASSARSENRSRYERVIRRKKGLGSKAVEAHASENKVGDSTHPTARKGKFRQQLHLDTGKCFNHRG